MGQYLCKDDFTVTLGDRVIDAHVKYFLYDDKRDPIELAEVILYDNIQLTTSEHYDLDQKLYDEIRRQHGV